MADHKVIKLWDSSPLVGQLDPVGKTKFKSGDTVILCEASGQAISIAGWQLIEECPFCQQTSKITDKGLPQKNKAGDKKHYEDPYPSRRPIISNRAIYALIGGILVLTLCIVSGVVLVNRSKLLTDTGPTQTRVLDPTETVEPVTSETVPNIKYTETSQPTLISSIEQTNDDLEKNTPTVIKPQAWKQGKLAYMIRQGKGAALVVLDLSSNETSTVLTSTNSLDFLGASFSPDGNNLAYYAYQEDLNLISPYSASQSRNLGKCQSPSWSPDGSSIICRAAGNRFSIINSNDGAIISQFPSNIRGVLPAWSPLGEEIVYAAFDGDRTNLWLTSITGSSPSLIAGDSSENYAPSWSPDGMSIAYQSNQSSSDSDIWVMNHDGNNKYRLTNTPNGGWSRAPSWSPDGKWLAYVSNQAGSIGADYGEIFIISQITGESFQVTNTGGKVYDWRVSWGR